MWSLRASDIYQGGENEPLPADRDVPAAFQSLDSERQKIYLRVDALNVCAHFKNANSPMTVLFRRRRCRPVVDDGCLMQPTHFFMPIYGLSGEKYCGLESSKEFTINLFR